MILSGKKVAERIFSETKELVSGLSIRPGLGVVLVGNDEASRIYVGIKERKAGELGVSFRKEAFPPTVTEDEVIRSIGTLNVDPSIHGIIVQLPLPSGLDTDRVVAAIDPRKDADGFHPETVRRFLDGERGSIPVFPQAIVELAKSAGTELSGRHGIVVANSELFGNIMKRALENESIATKVVLVRDIDARADAVSSAGVVVTATGKPERFSRSMFKDGAVVIDGGITERDGEVFGDVAKEGDDANIYLTPVPGGVGPVTVSCLLRRTAELAANG
jgi:methylenetetrahydrofolate dehydrogenase (NADP+)/methenyltetrahydrofolate cyclohydrolase